MGRRKKQIEFLRSKIVAYARDREFSEVGPVGERHGSWEQVLHKQASGLDRFVVIALTLVDETDTLEIWAGAEEGNRFVRQLINKFSSTSFDGLHDEIRESLDVAMDYAERVKSADLVEQYLPSRAQRS